jgi:transcription initiation factor IIE alpha subunit
MENTKSSYPYYPGFKDKEGSTSVEAAELIAAGSVTIREKCFNVIKQKGNFGATADEIAELLNLSSFTVRPRVTELYKQGKIERTDTRRNASKRNAYVYVISKKHINNQLTEKGV